jgi:hypothetical protein
MTKIAYNTCYGGFGLSDAAIMRYAELKGIKLAIGSNSNSICSQFYINGIEDDDHYFPSYEIERNRTDPILIQVIEELGAAANGLCSKIQIVDLPSGTRYRIDEYDGLESIQTDYQIDWNIA